MSCGEGLRAARRAALAGAAALCVLAPTVALGAPPKAGDGGGSTAPAKAAHKHKKAAGGKPAGAEAETPTQLTAPGQVGAGSLASELGSSGQVDPLSGLGIHNPVCDELGQIRSRPTRLSCEANGTPESNYPASNYGFDIFISTGVTHPVGDITYGFATVLNGIWLGLIFVLKLVLELLGLAFGLNPFADGKTMSQISAAVGRLYGAITDPWLSTLIVCGGIWFAYKGLLRRELAAGVAGTLAAIAMLVIGLWVVHQPRESVGPARRPFRRSRAGDDQRPAVGLVCAAGRQLRRSDVADLVAAGRGALRRPRLLRCQVGARPAARGSGAEGR